MPNKLANPYETVPEVPDPARRAYTVEQACSVLALGRTVLFDLIRRREIVSVKVGRRRLILAASLDAYLDRLVAEQSD
ncbi:MAG: helix-turn-helix domain-containing protein [Mycobacteriales bacterium]